MPHQRARWTTNDSFCPVLPVAVTVTGSKWNVLSEPSICVPAELSTRFWKPPLSAGIE